MIGQRLGPYEITAKLGEGGMGEVWRGDGKELFYVSASSDLMAVPIAAAADGQRFLLIDRIDPEVRSITLIQNWAATPSVE